jgi:hypothetical protein
VTFSNDYFASQFRKYESMITVHQLIKVHYNSFACPVIQFNNDRLYERDDIEDAYDTMVMESNLAARDLDEEMIDWTDDLSEDEQSHLIVT